MYHIPLNTLNKLKKVQKRYSYPFQTQIWMFFLRPAVSDHLTCGVENEALWFLKQSSSRRDIGGF